MLGVLLTGAGPRPFAPPQPTIVDTDFGLPPIDDAFALAFLLASPDVKVAAVTTVAGNQKLALENAQLAYALERLHRRDVPIYAGAARPIDAPPAYRAFLADGSRSTYFSVPVPPTRARSGGLPQVRAEAASAYIARFVIAHPHRVTIVCLGPLTNIARAIQADRRVAPAVRRLIIGGGYLRSDPWGRKPTGLPSTYAEFNFWVDPRAASIVLGSHVPIVLVPYNVNKQTPFTRGEYRTMLAGRSLFAHLLRSFAPAMPTYGGRPLPMFDEDVAVALVAPALTGHHRVALAVVTQHGPSFGVSIVMPSRSPNVDVLRDPRADAVRRLVAQRLAD